jgi:hypothetical protein
LLDAERSFIHFSDADTELSGELIEFVQYLLPPFELLPPLESFHKRVRWFNDVEVPFDGPRLSGHDVFFCRRDFWGKYVWVMLFLSSESGLLAREKAEGGFICCV